VGTVPEGELEAAVEARKELGREREGGVAGIGVTAVATSNAGGGGIASALTTSPT
jgi:hypothetical protein